MGGRKEDNTPIERVCGLGGHVDVEFKNGGAYLGVFEDSGKPYLYFELGGTAYIDDLIGALRRVKAKIQKAEE